jgi:hypothetical protein
VPKKKYRLFTIETRVGPASAASVHIALGSSSQHEVIVTPLRGTPRATTLSCIRSSGTAVEYDPAPPDAWDHGFGPIDRTTPVASRTANRTVKTGTAAGSSVLQVKQLEIDESLPKPVPYSVPVGDVDVSVTTP